MEDDQRPRGRGATRRDFLKSAGLFAAGAAAGGVGGGALGAALGGAGLGGAGVGGAGLGGEGGSDGFAELDLPSLAPRETPGFDHLVVVMFENRSFDNLLGYLYEPGDVPREQSFEGLAFGRHSNPGPHGEVAAHAFTGPTDDVMRQPSPDPGEEYAHVNTQLFATVDPPENAKRRAPDMLAPFNAPAHGSKPTMRGFVADYLNTVRAERREPIDEAALSELAMGGFTPAMLPVLSTLARSFAVYDHWHCAVPSQTFCNRSFFHASTSHGFVTNSGGLSGYRKWFDAPPAPTIFNRLEAAGISWRVYFDERQLVSMTGFIHAPALRKFWRSNFRPMHEFYDDAREGKLAAYSFIEPRMVYDHNDMHPPVGPLQAVDVDGATITNGAISDIRAGEALIHAIYDAVRTSASHKGSNAMNTMLLVTFDEHGGTFDHVPPPRAVAPGRGERGEQGFAFDRLGVRVPTIAISAYTRAGAVINETMHHGSVISTLTQKYGLDALTNRDRGAPTLANAVTLGTPRQPAQWPETHAAYVPSNPEANGPHPGDEDRPLSAPGVGLVGMLLAHYGRLGEPVPTTYRGAFELLDRAGRGLFGPQRRD